MKKCSKCSKNKKLDEYNKSKKGLYGLKSFCKICDKKIALVYSRTKLGIISRLYSSQKFNSKQRNHNAPSYTNKEFKEYLLDSDKFNKLYKKWCESGYDAKLKPSCDRLDDYKGYSFANIKITTWSKNNKKGSNDRFNGLNNKVNKTVIQKTMDGTIVKKTLFIV